MISLNLSSIERAELCKSQKLAKDTMTHIKATVIMLLDNDVEILKISKSLSIDVSTIYRYVETYKTKGLAEYLNTHYKGYWGSLSSIEISALRSELKGKLYTTSREVSKWVESRFNVKFTDAGMVKLLKRIGFSYKQTKQVPCERDIVKQEAFVKKFENLLTTAKEENAVIYFLDGVHPTHNTRSTHGWIEKGEEYELQTVSGRDRVNINGAINATDVCEVHVVESESVNSQSTRVLFEKLISKNKPDTKIYAISDNARYYHEKGLKEWREKTKIEQVFLPAYSPNLNPIERLWKFTRKKVINSEFYRTKEEFRAAIMSFFDNIHIHKSELETLITLNFHISKREAPS